MNAEELLALVEKMTPGPYESGIWIVTAADGSGVFGTNMASKDQDQCRANGDGAAALYNHAASIITSLQAERDALRADAESRYPNELFDGPAVLAELTDLESRRTSAENVSDVLDAVVRLMKRRITLTRKPSNG